MVSKIAAQIMIIIIINGCGYKGDLYLPQPEEHHSSDQKNIPYKENVISKTNFYSKKS